VLTVHFAPVTKGLTGVATEREAHIRVEGRIRTAREKGH
jgi:hypothetical protein